MVINLPSRVEYSKISTRMIDHSHLGQLTGKSNYNCIIHIFSKRVNAKRHFGILYQDLIPFSTKEMTVVII